MTPPVNRRDFLAQAGLATAALAAGPAPRTPEAPTPSAAPNCPRAWPTR